MSKNYIAEIILQRDKIPDLSQYPYNLDVIKNLTNLEFSKGVTFFIGENGTGKSTLLEAIAIAFGFNPEGGSKNFSFKTRSSHSDLYKHLTLSRGISKPKDGYFLRAESFYNVATEIEKLDEEGFGPKVINAYGGRYLHNLSHGESFLSLIMKRFKGNGLYILDEPEAALSPSKQLSLLVRIKELLDQDSQFIIATHSPIIMSFPNSLIYEISKSEIRSVDYAQTDHFNLYKDFLNNHESFLNHLLSSS